MNFDTDSADAYYTPPMAGGPQDQVDCERLAAECRTLEREYPLDRLPRLQDLLADGRGSVRARFRFSRAESGRCAVAVSVEAKPRLVCQRCLEGYEFPVTTHSELEVSAEPQADDALPAGELVASAQGRISLREVAEEELLLALPLIPACSDPQRCGHGPGAALVQDEEPDKQPDEQQTVRPFAGLQELLKRHDRK